MFSLGPESEIKQLQPKIKQKRTFSLSLNFCKEVAAQVNIMGGSTSQVCYVACNLQRSS